MIKQAVRLFGSEGTVIGQVVAVDRYQMGYSMINPENEYDDDVALRIARGRAMSEHPFTLDDFKARSTNYMTTEYIEYCETTLLAKLYDANGPKDRKTIRSIINADIVYNKDRVPMLWDKSTPAPYALFVKNDEASIYMTSAEILYPYLVVVNDRMKRYFSKMTATKFQDMKNREIVIAESKLEIARYRAHAKEISDQISRLTSNLDAELQSLMKESADLNGRADAIQAAIEKLTIK